MSGRWRRPFHDTDTATGLDDSYECLHCEATFDAWPGGCPECDGLVFRVVDPQTGHAE